MYESRVKGISYQNDHLATISSNGDVTVWTVNIENQEITELCTTNIGCRPICLTMLNLADFADEYILKREDSETGAVEESTVKSTKKSGSSVKNVGKVVIEEDDEEETIVIRAKDKKQTNKTKQNKKNTPTKSSEPKSMPKSNKKRKSADNTKSSAKKKSKLQKSQNNSGFIVEDME